MFTTSQVITIWVWSAYITDDFGAKPTKRRIIYFRLPLEYKGNKQSRIAGMIN